MSNDTYPDKPGCYIAGNHGHYAVAELCSRYGASRSEQHVGNCYLADPDDVSHELLVDIADKIEARWNESSPTTSWPVGGTASSASSPTKKESSCER